MPRSKRFFSTIVYISFLLRDVLSIFVGLCNVSEYQSSVLQLKVDKLRLVEVCGTSESEFSCVSVTLFIYLFF